MNKYGLPLTAPSRQTVVPAMNASGLMYGYYIINTTTFDGTETVLTLPDTVVPITTVTLDYNPTEPDRVTQYMAAVFPINTRADTQPWSSASLIQPGDGLSREWIVATQGTIARETRGVLLTAISTSMAPNLGPVSAPSSPSLPTSNTPMNWSATVPSSVFASGNSFFDVNWKSIFDGQSPAAKGVILTIISGPPSGLRAAVIGTPVDTPANPIAQLGQWIVYETIRFINMGAVPGVYVFNLRVTSDDSSTTNVTFTLTLTA